VLELEGELAGLSGTLEDVGVEAVLLNGDEVRSALAHGFAFSFSAVVELPRGQVPRALGAMESAGWQWMRPGGDARYFRRGVVVRIRARGLRRRDHGSLAKGRFGFAEPEAKVAEGEPQGSLGPLPFDPGGPRRTGSIGAALGLAAEAMAALDTWRLRTQESEFHGVRVQYGPGVFSFQLITERLADAVLARLPQGPGVRFVEVGTGTGAVALSVAQERLDVEVLATDVSLRALGWARRNRRRLGIHNVRLAHGSLLAPVPPDWHGHVATIAANLPLGLPHKAVELRGVRGWPVGTATGPGADGLGLVRALARDARDVLAPGGHLQLHLLSRQALWIAKYLDELGYQAEIPPDASKQPYAVEVPARWPGPTPT
jgi:methylase of polypeptide subunit release factors